LNKPVYILTSTNTFSAAEDFAYNLQALKRAVIIGSKTRGGANAGRTFRINEHFEIYIPVGKAINPITGKNWEGGIIPDIVTASKEALRKAQIVALQKLIDIAESPQKKQQLQSFLNEIPTN
jgi:C-terminal processing protease CtpA/Prc